MKFHTRVWLVVAHFTKTFPEQRQSNKGKCHATGKWHEIVENKSFRAKHMGLRMTLPLTGYIKWSRKHKDLPGRGMGYAGLDRW